MIRAIIVRILRDAWMVAPGLVSKRGDRFRGHRIRQPFSPRALNAQRSLGKRCLWHRETARSGGARRKKEKSQESFPGFGGRCAETQKCGMCRFDRQVGVDGFNSEHRIIVSGVPLFL